MTDIQRWRFGPYHVDEGDSGGYVTYADHVAAVAEAEQRKDREWLATIHDSHLYSLGQRDAIAKAIAAVKGLATERELRSPSAIYVDLRDVTDRITAVGGE
jgi:hypothetical protein